MAAREINDGQPPKSQADWTGNEKTFVVRSAMREGARHPHDCFPFHGFEPAKVKLTCDAAHVPRSVVETVAALRSGRHLRPERCCCSFGAIREDKRQGCETSAIVPSDAWERCPSPSVTCETETIRQVGPTSPEHESQPWPERY